MTLGIPLSSGFTRTLTAEESRRYEFSAEDRERIQNTLADIHRCQAHALAHAHECVVWR
jgi:hypothetical protein